MLIGVYKTIRDTDIWNNYSRWIWILVFIIQQFLQVLLLLYTWHTKYAEGVYSFRRFRPSFRPSVIPSVNPFYNQVLLRSFLITYNSTATDQKFFIFGMGVPGRALFHSTSMNPRHAPGLEVKI